MALEWIVNQVVEAKAKCRARGRGSDGNNNKESDSSNPSSCPTPDVNTVPATTVNATPMPMAKEPQLQQDRPSFVTPPPVEWLRTLRSCTNSCTTGTAARFRRSKLVKYYHWLHCACFLSLLAFVLLIQALTTPSAPNRFGFVQAQRFRSLYSMSENGTLTTIKPPNVIHFGNSNMLIVLKHRLDIGTVPGSEGTQGTPSPSSVEEARRNRDDEYFVPFNCPCGSTLTPVTKTTTASCQTFECCVCQLKCPMTTIFNNSYHESAEWMDQFVRDNCPQTSPSISFEERLIEHDGFAKKFWSCSQPRYFPNKIHSTWFPFFCLHKDNLAYLGNYYEKHPKLSNMQRERFWRRSGYGFGQGRGSGLPHYSWKSETGFGSEPPLNTLDTELGSLTPPLEVIHEILLPLTTHTNASGNTTAATIRSAPSIKILGGSKCFRSLGLLRPGLSSYLPCGIQMTIDQNSECDEIRRGLDTAAEALLEIHLKTESTSTSYWGLGAQVQRAFVNHTGIFTHEPPARGERAMHCSNLTLGVEVVTTFYNGRPLGIRINYMKRDDQLVSPSYVRRFHITSTTSTVNKTLVSKYSRFWANILTTECPADYCWRDILQAAKPVVESSGLLLPYEAELFALACFGGLAALAVLLLHEFMRMNPRCLY